MIIRVATTSRPQQRHAHRLRNLVQRTGDLAIAVVQLVSARVRSGRLPPTAGRRSHHVAHLGR
jgi:hypothetical protein